MKLDTSKITTIDLTFDPKRFMVLIGIKMPIKGQKKLMRTFLGTTRLVTIGNPGGKQYQKKQGIRYLEGVLNEAIDTLSFTKNNGKERRTFLVDKDRLKEIKFFALSKKDNFKWKSMGKKGKSLEELKEKYYGKKGTKKRDAYEKEVSGEIAKERIKQKIK